MSIKRLICLLIGLTMSFSISVRADVGLSGYFEFFGGSADQTKYNGADANQGVDKAGLSDGLYSRIHAVADTTLDNGINVAVTYTLAKDCRATSTGNCGVSNNQSDVAFTSGFGSVNIGNTASAGTILHSRITAEIPTGEPDGAVIAEYYSSDVANTYGQANEVGYARNDATIRYVSNTYEGLTLAISHAPNMAENYVGDADNGQDNSYTGGVYNDFNEIVVKYDTEFDGFGFAATAGYGTGNAGQQAGINYNDLSMQTYTVRGSFGGFTADWRMNDGSDSGRATNDGSGGNVGTSICGMYTTGAITVGACEVTTDFDSSLTAANETETRTVNAGYNLGGGVNLDVAFYSFTQTANHVTRTDVDGVDRKSVV